MEIKATYGKERGVSKGKYEIFWIIVKNKGFSWKREGFTGKKGVFRGLRLKSGVLGKRRKFLGIYDRKLGFWWKNGGFFGK